MTIKTLAILTASIILAQTTSANPEHIVLTVSSSDGVVNSINDKIPAKFVLQDGYFWCKSSKEANLYIAGQHMNSDIGLYASKDINSATCKYRLESVNLGWDTRIWTADENYDVQVRSGTIRPITLKFTGKETARTQSVRIEAGRSLYQVEGAPTTGSPVELVVTETEAR